MNAPTPHDPPDEPGLDGRIPFLQTVPVFGGLERLELERLAGYALVRRFEADLEIVHEGDLAKEMFIVIEGGVDIVKGDPPHHLSHLSKGDAFGEMALIDIQPRSASVRTTAPTELLVLRFDDIIRIYQFNIQTYTMIVLNIAREISRRLRQANRIIVASGGRAEIPEL